MFDEKERIAVCVADIVDNFVGVEGLRVQSSTHILNQMVRHRHHKRDLQDELLPVDLPLLLLELEDFSEVLALQVERHATLLADQIERTESNREKEIINKRNCHDVIDKAL